jgi:hypothetical protein
MWMKAQRMAKEIMEGNSRLTGVFSKVCERQKGEGSNRENTAREIWQK